MAKGIMIQGTSSGAGKSLTVTGLCRIFREDGFTVAPFKSQNMALNSFITAEGLEMGRAQVVQAEAAGIEPSVLMNPILLKPTGDATSQVIVNGEVVASLGAAEYYRRKHEFIPAVRDAYRALAAQYDIVVLEGAGSPAEINLRQNDFVNMGMAAMADVPVLLVGDIDRGGVFASLYGTIALLEPEERARIKGCIINKFRGDVNILRPGLVQLEQLTHIPVLGVVPWTKVDIEDEDSVSTRLDSAGGHKPLDAAVIRLPRLSNFTDFIALEHSPYFSVRYVESARALRQPDIIIIPGTKNTMADLAWMRQNGLEAAIKKQARAGVPLIGVCGGFQMLGQRLDDPLGIEQGGTMRGMELLPLCTRFEPEKTRTRVDAVISQTEGFFACLANESFSGYEIHMGVTEGDVQPFSTLSSDGPNRKDGAVLGSIAGTYVHGLFDSGNLAVKLAQKLLADKGMDIEDGNAFDYQAHKQRQFDILATAMRDSLDMKAIYTILGLPQP